MRYLSRKSFKIFLLIILLLSIPSSLYIAQQEQDIRQFAALSDGTLPTKNPHRASSPTPTPTASPTSAQIPPLTPTATTVPTPPLTQTTILSPTPQVTIVSSGPTLSLNLLLQGIGFGGDNLTPGARGNFNPIFQNRSVHVSLHNASDQQIGAQDGTISFLQGSGNFTGNISFTEPVPVGSYVVRISSPRYLIQQIPGFLQVTSANQTGTIIVNQAVLVLGDSNGDNRLDILDYNISRDCYSDALPPLACSDPVKKISADLNDDGNVNQFDYNLLIRNVSIQRGK